MRRSAIALFLLFFGISPCYSDVILSLSSMAPDLNSLTPGQGITFQVSLSGLDAGGMVSDLEVEVLFDSGILGVPSITAGSIVPEVSPPYFTVGTGPGQAAVEYSRWTLPWKDFILQNGVFFSLDATVIGTGSGTIAFGAVDVSGEDAASGNLFVSAGPGLALTSSPGAVIPEPSSLVLLGLGLGALGLGRRRKRRIGG